MKRVSHKGVDPPPTATDCSASDFRAAALDARNAKEEGPVRNPPPITPAPPRPASFREQKDALVMALCLPLVVIMGVGVLLCGVGRLLGWIQP